jgi:YVTN family beta-propeller protein
VKTQNIIKVLVCFLFTLSAAAQHTTAVNPKNGNGERSLADNAWGAFTAGDKMFTNSMLYNPAGQTLGLEKGSRVLNLVLAQQGKFLVVKKNNGLAVIDADRFTMASALDYEKKESGSMFGLTMDANDSTVYYTGAKKNLYVANISKAGALTLTKKIDVSVNDKTTTPLGIGLCGNKIALVALAIPNKVAIVDVAAAKVVGYIPVGICPYAIVISKDKKFAFVSNFGGPHPEKGDRTEKSAGTDVAVDERSVALRGSVTVIDIVARKAVSEVKTRIHPESMVLSPDGGLLYVSDESGDGLSVIDTKTFAVIQTLSTKPDISLPYGSLTTALAFSPDGKVLFTANAGNNAIGLIDPKHLHQGPYGFLAAGGFPGAVCTDGRNLYIGNVTPLKEGSLQKVVIPQNKAQLDAYSDTAKKGFHFIDMLRAQALANFKAKPVPVPVNTGEPSALKHVVYIIRENKTFDQELGDIGMGNSDPKLVQFGDSVTPNAHRLAKQFLLLDNYYCNGVNSSDGHQWAIQGITTPYHEKDFSGGRCAYDFGTDPLSYAGCGFIWDHLLRKGISFRNFGETDLAEVTPGKTWTNIYDAWKTNSDSIWYKCAYQMGTLKKYSDLRFPGWNLTITDQVRADRFIEALHEYEVKGSLPEFIIIYLPNDHTSGFGEGIPTPRAYVADNDLATGRVIEALTKSPFWKDMAIFVNEDDPQSGTDHVDAHRSVCYVASPYAKRHTLLSKFYNQSSVLHTICQIFGVKPMNQLVAMAPLMTDCFVKMPDFSGFTALIPSIAINEMNPPKNKLDKSTALLATLTQRMDFSKPDMIDSDALIFSKYVWSTIYGKRPFPAKYFGVQPKNLRALGLQLESHGKKRDD